MGSFSSIKIILYEFNNDDDSNPCGFFIIAVMGQRLEPWSQALSRFKRTLENKFSRVRNSL